MFGGHILPFHRNGVDFLGKQGGLREGCFIAMEAVSWLMNNVAGAESRREAARMMQELVEEQLVRHASGDSSIPFLDGYFIYCIPGNKDGKLFLSLSFSSPSLSLFFPCPSLVTLHFLSFSLSTPLLSLSSLSPLPVLSYLSLSPSPPLSLSLPLLPSLSPLPLPLSLSLSSLSLPLLPSPLSLPLTPPPLPEETTTERVERSFLIIEGMEFDVFTKKWFEVAIRFPSYSPHLNSTPIPIFATSPSPSSSPTPSLQHNHLPYYMGFKDKETTHHGEPLTNVKVK